MTVRKDQSQSSLILHSSMEVCHFLTLFLPWIRVINFFLTPAGAKYFAVAGAKYSMCISITVQKLFSRLSTLTLSKLSGQVEDARRPSLFSFLQISSPSVSRSTIKQVMPLYPCKSTRVSLLPHYWATILLNAFLHKDTTAGKQNNFGNNILKKHTHRWQLTADRSALAMTRKTPAFSALLIHILDPLMM